MLCSPDHPQVPFQMFGSDHSVKSSPGCLQGTHTAIKSGMLAAEAAFNALTNSDSISPADLSSYEEDLKASWVWDELHDSRNIRPGFAKLGLYGGLVHAAVDTVLLRGGAPWTLRQRHAALVTNICVRSSASCLRFFFTFV